MSESSFLVRVDGTDLEFRVAPGERVLGAARRAGVWLPFECGWGTCGQCKTTLVSGEIAALVAESPALNERDVRRGKFLACQSTAASDLVIKPVRLLDGPPPERPVRDAVGVLERIEELGPDIRRFTFVLDAVASFRPGQHAILDLGEGVRRCYSMSCLPGSERVEFIAKLYRGHVGTERLFALDVGARVPMELPYGDMYLRGGSAPIVLVAGGTGVSAMLALLRQLASASDERRVTLIYGARTRAELVCYDELVGLCAALPSADVVGVLGQPDADWTGASGFVTDVFADRDFGDAAVYYVAGPPVMTNATVDLLASGGVQLTNVHFDAFG